MKGWWIGSVGCVIWPDDCRSVIAPLYKGKGERTECKNYRSISFLSMVGKIYARILVDIVYRVVIIIIKE